MKKTSRSGIMLAFFILLVSCVIAYISSARSLTVGDTYNYKEVFQGYLHGVERLDWGLGYHLFLKGVSSVANSYRVYFFAHTFVVLTIFFLILDTCYRRLNDESSKYLLVILGFSFLFLSSWFATASMNGLRQGLSLPILYLSLLLLYEKKKLAASLSVLLAVSIHVSNLLIVPFLILFVLPPSYLLASLSFGSILYVTQFNSFLVEGVSNVLNVSLHQQISEYGQHTMNFHGFNLPFFLYSIFWFFVGYFLTKKYKSKETIRLLQKTTFIYGILLLPFLYFGFGAYVNRYAMLAWFFLPVLQASLLAGVIKNTLLWASACIVTLIVSCIFFYFRVHF